MAAAAALFWQGAVSITFALVGALTCAFPSHPDKGYKKHVALSLLQDLYLNV